MSPLGWFVYGAIVSVIFGVLLGGVVLLGWLLGVLFNRRTPRRR